MRVQLPAIWDKAFIGQRYPMPILYSVYSDINIAREALKAIYNNYNSYNDLDGDYFGYYDDEGHFHECYIDYVEYNKLD